MKYKNLLCVPLMLAVVGTDSILVHADQQDVKSPVSQQYQIQPQHQGPAGSPADQRGEEKSSDKPVPETGQPSRNKKPTVSAGATKQRATDRTLGNIQRNNRSIENSMRSLDNSIRRMNTDINRIRTLERRF